jgi:hypothetical protein
MRRIGDAPLIRIVLALLTMTVAADAQMYRPEDSSINCIGREDCQRLVGRQLWVTVNHNEICATINPRTGCRKIPPEFGVRVEGIAGDGPLDLYFRVRAQDGKVGYISRSNAHLLTYTDPRPAREARKREQAAEAKRRDLQAKADADALAAMRKEDLEKACILAAAERLPRIPGIVINSSRAVPLPPEIPQKPLVFTTSVEIAATAAGQSVTYLFVCAKGARTPSIIHPVGQR